MKIMSIAEQEGLKELLKWGPSLRECPAILSSTPWRSNQGDFLLKHVG